MTFEPLNLEQLISPRGLLLRGLLLGGLSFGTIFVSLFYSSGLGAQTSEKAQASEATLASETQTSETSACTPADLKAARSRTELDRRLRLEAQDDLAVCERELQSRATAPLTDAAGKLNDRVNELEQLLNTLASKK